MSGKAQKVKKERESSRFWRVFLGKDILTTLCFVIIVVFVLAAIFAPYLTNYTPYQQNL